MTPEQRYDRLERVARLMCEAALRSSRECRKQTAQLGCYVEARKEYEVARLAVAAKSDDSVSSETLHRAREILNEARDALTR